jgi:Flp pilus assembly protein TadD
MAATLPRAGSQDIASLSTQRERMHQSDQWAEIQKHLPDPATSSPEILEQQADILRARRFPEDAMDYYKYAMDRGGNPPALLNKQGLAELEMHHDQLARVYFQRVVKMDKKNAEAWNNLGASEFIDGRNETAISDYKKAIKLSRHIAVFHANLANAYFEAHNDSGSRREIATALELDPHVFENEGTGGVAAHVLSAADEARFSFEMAKMYARTSMEDAMLRALGKAAEAGMDIRQEMERDPVLAKYSMDPRVIVVVRNAEMLRATHVPTISTSSADMQAQAGQPL